MKTLIFLPLYVMYFWVIYLGGIPAVPWRNTDFVTKSFNIKKMFNSPRSDFLKIIFSIPDTYFSIPDTFKKK